MTKNLSRFLAAFVAIALLVPPALAQQSESAEPEEQGTESGTASSQSGCEDIAEFGGPCVYGLAAGGQEGVEQGLEILKTELDCSMALLGCNSISDIRPEHVRQLA